MVALVRSYSRYLRRHLAAERNRDARQFFREDRPGAPLMRLVGEVCRKQTAAAALAALQLCAERRSAASSSGSSTPPSAAMRSGTPSAQVAAAPAAAAFQLDIVPPKRCSQAISTLSRSLRW
jgi:hypothetical protein